VKNKDKYYWTNDRTLGNNRLAGFIIGLLLGILSTVLFILAFLGKVE